MTEGPSEGPEGRSEGHLGPSGDRSGGSILGSNEVDSGGQMRSILDPISETSLNTGNCLHLAVGRALRLIMTKYGVLGGYMVVPGIALPALPPGPIPRVHPPPPRVHAGTVTGYTLARTPG